MIVSGSACVFFTGFLAAPLTTFLAAFLTGFFAIVFLILELCFVTVLGEDAFLVFAPAWCATRHRAGNEDRRRSMRG